MKKYRSLISLILIFAFCVNVMGYCFFSLLVITHKRSTFNRLLKGNYEKVDLVNFTSDDLRNARWEHEKEFELDGNMYDVVKSESMDGVVHIICKMDSKEDHLKKQKRKAADQTTAKHMVKLNQIFVQYAMDDRFMPNIPCIVVESGIITCHRYNSPPPIIDLPPKI